MEIAIVVPVSSLDTESAMDNLDVTVTGKVSILFSSDTGISDEIQKAEMFENLISMGLIDEEALDGIGYYKLLNKGH